MTTLKQAQAELRSLGMVLTHSDGEYRVNFKGGAERTASYTNDIDDAVGTGRAMAKWAEEEADRILGAKPGERAGGELLLGPGTTREEFFAGVLQAAESFTAIRHDGRDKRQRRDAKTLREACEAAAELGVERSLIYAVTAAGRSVLILAGGKAVRP